MDGESVLHAGSLQPSEAAPGGTQDRAFSIIMWTSFHIVRILIIMFDFICVYFFPGPSCVDCLLTCIYAT